MPVIVVGGHSRNIGKTSVVCALIAALSSRRWTAIKITQFGHGVCSANGEPCDCQTGDHTVALSEEIRCDSGTDSSRFLKAGAARSFWLRTRQGQLADGLPKFRKLLRTAEHVIVESNSILRFIRPDLYVSVLDPEVLDFKASALRYLDRADAIVLTSRNRDAPAGWPGVSEQLIGRAPRFLVAAPSYSSEELVSFVQEKLKKAERESVPLLPNQIIPSNGEP